jgi:hypothetical protein
VSVQAESFQAAWARLSSLGLDLVRASFEIGWELAHLAYAFSAGKMPAQGTSTYQEILEVDDLTDTEDMQVRVEHIASALRYFDNHSQSRIPDGVNLTVPSIDSLTDALATTTGDIGAELAKFHVATVKACAALDGTSASQADGSELLINGLKDAYEVGRLLAALVLKACDAGDEDLRKHLSITPEQTSGQQETAAFRAHSMLGGLRDCFPSAAAYSVARHLEDWSDWVNGNQVDYAEPFNPAQARAAIAGQGRVWKAMLSGQTLARDYIVAEGVADAANRLFVNWAASATAIARSFLRTALARFFLILGVLVLLVFIGAFLIDLFSEADGTSGAKDGLTITAMLAAAGSAAGIFHVSRTQLTSILGDIWSEVKPAMIEAELIESIALSTRRLPLDTVGGAAPPQTKTVKARMLRAKYGSLLPPNR